MSETKQIFLAFSIPLLSALGLFLVRGAVFPNKHRYSDVHVVTGNEPLFSAGDVPLVVTELGEYFAIGLLVLSLILPFFVMTRTYQSRKYQLKSKSDFE